MDYQEAINTLKDEVKCSCYRNRGYCGICTIYSKMDRDNIIDACKCAISAMQELQEYKQLGTLEEVREVMEKRKPEKISTHINNSDLKIGNVVFRKGTKIHKCKCGRAVMLGYKFCPGCGQHIDWGEEE